MPHLDQSHSFSESVSAHSTADPTGHVQYVQYVRLERWLPWLLGLAVLWLYAATAAPSLVTFFDDSLELQLVGPTFGIAHPTGYPLYTLLGGLWSRAIFPFGNWAWRMNLFSALTAAGVVVLVFLVARRLSGAAGGLGRELAALAAAVAFALGPVWWSQATLAEVYALHGLFVAGILHTALAAGDRRPKTPPPSPLAPLFLLLGLSLAHHRTTLLLLPGLAIFLLWQAPGIWRPQRVWLTWAVALLAPLSLYTYIPVRAAMGARDLNGDYVNTWAGFWRHVLASGYAGFLRGNPLAVARTPADWLTLFQAQVGWPYLAVALVGLAGLAVWRNRAPAWTLVAVVFLTNLLFALIYRVGDVEVFLLPAFLCLALLVGNGVGVLGRLSPGGRRVGEAVQVALILGLIWGVGGRGPAVNRDQEWAAHDLAVAMAGVDFPPQSRVIGLVGEVTALWYMQQAEGLGHNALPVAADDPEERRARVAEAIAAGYPVYLTRELAGIETRYSFSGEGPLVRVWPRGQARPRLPSHPLDLTFLDGALRVVGYDLDRLAQAGGPAWRIALYWQPTASLSRTLKVSLRVQTADGWPLSGADGRPVIEDRFPLHQVAPTWAWAPDEVVRDVHTVALPLHGDGQAQQLLVIVYDAETVAEVGRWTVALRG